MKCLEINNMACAKRKIIRLHMEMKIIGQYYGCHLSHALLTCKSDTCESYKGYILRKRHLHQAQKLRISSNHPIEQSFHGISLLTPSASVTAGHGGTEKLSP